MESGHEPRNELSAEICGVIERYYPQFRFYYELMENTLEGVAKATYSEPVLETRPANELRNFNDHLFIALSSRDRSTTDLNISRAIRHIIIGMRDCLIIPIDNVDRYSAAYIEEIDQILGLPSGELRLKLGMIRAARKAVPNWKFVVMEDVQTILKDIELLTDIIHKYHDVLTQYIELYEGLREGFPLKGPFLQGLRRKLYRTKQQIARNWGGAVARVIGSIIAAILIWLWGYWSRG